jgi:hypothetical protein
MADKNSFPQIPSTVWWGMRAILQRTPNATIDDRYLGTHLDVQDAAARQYITELKRVGLLSDEGRATPVANKWRHDETYWEAVLEILQASYPDGLLQVAPPGEADRQKVVSWFAREGLGTGTANNKAATYLLIGSRAPNEPPSRTQPSEKKPGTVRSTSSKPPRQKSDDSKTDRLADGRIDPIPLNVNVQIHISADASTDQIESIFAAMRRYLYENPAS